MGVSRLRKKNVLLSILEKKLKKAKTWKETRWAEVETAERLAAEEGATEEHKQEAKSLRLSLLARLQAEKDTIEDMLRRWKQKFQQEQRKNVAKSPFIKLAPSINDSDGNIPQVQVGINKAPTSVENPGMELAKSISFVSNTPILKEQDDCSFTPVENIAMDSQAQQLDQPSPNKKQKVLKTSGKEGFRENKQLEAEKKGILKAETKRNFNAQNSLRYESKQPTRGISELFGRRLGTCTFLSIMFSIF